tara:strand:- start:269 stop:1225 length:957 start_codon:yes stop_codon:yes gene_type:complete
MSKKTNKTTKQGLVIDLKKSRKPVEAEREVVTVTAAMRDANKAAAAKVKTALNAFVKTVKADIVDAAAKITEAEKVILKTTMISQETVSRLTFKYVQAAMAFNAARLPGDDEMKTTVKAITGSVAEASGIPADHSAAFTRLMTRGVKQGLLPILYPETCTMEMRGKSPTGKIIAPDNMHRPKIDVTVEEDGVDKHKKIDNPKTTATRVPVGNIEKLWSALQPKQTKGPDDKSTDNGDGGKGGTSMRNMADRLAGTLTGKPEDLATISTEELQDIVDLVAAVKSRFTTVALERHDGIINYLLAQVEARGSKAPNAVANG